MTDERFTKISFYVVAHADDWQLFMQPNTYNDLVATGSKVVFIVTTAGDAGVGETFYAAREEGLKSSIRFCLAPLAALSESIGTKEFNQHNICCWLVNNSACYFLRLPDGNLDGGGFSLHHYQSLLRFKTGQINTITAIDNSAVYDSWSDFHNTLQSIIQFEARGIPGVCINYLNPDTRKNPNDHTDHIATGQALQEMPILSGLQQALFVGYSVNKTKENLPPNDLFWKAGMFAAYEKAVYDNSGYSTLQESVSTYINWCLGGPDFITIIP